MAPKVPGVVDPTADNNNNQGDKIYQQYRDAGLELYKANNAVAPGINEVFARFRTGRLKIASHLTEIFQEINTYARDKNGKVIKDNDHLLDAVRYVCVSGLQYARIRDKRKSPWDTVTNTVSSWVTA